MYKTKNIIKRPI